MYKIAVLGPHESVMAFQALGMEVFSAAGPEDAEKRLHWLARQDYAVVYVMEETAAGLESAIERYKNVPFPAVILLPGSQGSTGLGMSALKANVEKALGADILFNK